MKAIYVVFEDIDEDGGFGDAIPTKEPVIAYHSKAKAEKYVKENSHEEVYDVPYDELKRGGLHVEVIPIGEN
ncbi:hypothetical protein EFM42_07350 [Levilactobacillus brevis]|uniref:hypothetical protein n=1 Tax=Levilactobacillus brevis TaxID=1580 RepID=UPI0021A798E6|nr:hypothetical protein [Levilactobacillus brevis]MCT2887229.1 hypothetical protein [Levilactobacillus brevis]